ncbi:MAG: Rne/Rng family ribonuclease [Deltaproteobacteria bacterium]|nr:Rne/Rng family ribonuclease [Deltaproteobacteria bacterium]
MAKKILINTIDEEESRMAIIEDGKLLEFNIQMSVKEPTTGNIYKGIVQRVERGLQAAFVEYGGDRNGFLPLNDVSPEYFVRSEEGENTGKPEGKPVLKVGQELLVQVVREQKNRKGAMLTTYLSLPGRYLVLMPGKRSSGISRKIEDEADRKKLKEIMGTIAAREEMGFIVRTAGVNRTKQELLRDFQILLRLWKDIKKKAERTSAPALIYQESDFAVRSLRDYYTSDVDEILVDSLDTYRKMRTYFKAVSPRNVKMIRQYKEDTPIFNKYNLEDQIDEVYRERVNLKYGSYLIITPTEAMITIDVNSGRATNRKDVEETAFRTNLAAAEEIARQLRLRDLGGLIVIDFIDMKDQKHNAQVEKVFKKSLKVDRSRIQLSKISRFGILELSRQKKQSTIQEISYTSCPHCKGTGMRPSMEYIALNTFRKIKSEAVKGDYSAINVSLPYEVSDYLLNQKRSEMSKMEMLYDISIHVSGSRDVLWGECSIEMTKRAAKAEEVPPEQETEPIGPVSAIPESEGKAQQKTPFKGRRPQRRRRRRPTPQVGEQVKESNGSTNEEKQILSEDIPKTTEENTSSESEPETVKEKKKWKVGFFDIFKT